MEVSEMVSVNNFCKNIKQHRLYFTLFTFLLFGIFLLLIWALHMIWGIIEAAVCRCSVKKLFLKISQNSQENTCASTFSKVAGTGTPYLTEHLRWTLLKIKSKQTLSFCEGIKSCTYATDEMAVHNCCLTVYQKLRLFIDRFFK